MGIRTFVMGAAGMLLALAPISAQEWPEVDWLVGPAEAQLGSRATLEVPEDMLYLGRSDTLKVLEFMENPTSGLELGCLTSASNDESWWLYFDFDDMGYVSDDDQDDLDADDIFESLDEGNEIANEERRQRGWAEYHLVSWESPPLYNATTKNLEWAIRGESAGNLNLNHNIRILGREGVMVVTYVGDLDTYDKMLPRVQEILKGFQFVEGQRYGEYREGDKLAEYGLVALVTGGAAALALKTGFFKKFGKLLVVAVIALAGAIKKLLNKLRGS